MLYEFLMEYCYNAYNTQEGCGSSSCTHPLGQCKFNHECWKCLQEAYYTYPWETTKKRKQYNCEKLTNSYVYRSLDRYASEIWYALNESDKLKEYSEYNVLSIGCGPATDLVAIDYFNKVNKLYKPINYFGIDKETAWEHIHQKIMEFKENDPCLNSVIFDTNEILDSLPKIDEHFNIFVFEYIISSFNSKGNLADINKIYDCLIKKLIENDTKEALIIINDVNRTDRGRDKFVELIASLQSYELPIRNIKQKYFQYDQYGQKYERIDTIFGQRFSPNLWPNNKCTSAQLIVNIGES